MSTGFYGIDKPGTGIITGKTERVVKETDEKDRPNPHFCPGNKPVL